MTDSIQNATPPKSTRSKNSVHIQIAPNFQFEFVPRDTKESQSNLHREHNTYLEPQKIHNIFVCVVKVAIRGKKIDDANCIHFLGI